MKRREFITLLGAATAWPLAVRAQQPAMPVIGFLSSATAKQWSAPLGAFLEGLSEAEIIVSRDVTIEYSWADGQYDRLPALAAGLVQRQVSVIAALTTPAAVAARAATGTIPIVFSTIGDPVQLGLVASLRRPGGNITGATYLNVEVGPKLLELLHELVPTASTVAALVNPTNPNAEILSNSLLVAARTLGLKLHVLKASTDRDINTAFETLIQFQVGGLVLPSDVFMITREEQLAALARQPQDRQRPRPHRPASADRPRRRGAISSTLVVCWTGRSAGFSPLRTRAVYAPACRYAFKALPA
jgi:ABC-type uncharacterized transport system substrate-binding protein